MQIEVEAKAHVREESAKDVIDFLSAKFGSFSKVSKNDFYFRNSDGEFRIRKENNKFFYNKKQYAIDKNGFESNSEFEKEIDARDAYELKGDLKPFFTKTKVGYIWNTNYNTKDVNIEFLSVNNLGLFLEIELILDSDSDDIDNEKLDAKKWIMQIFKSLHLDKSIENRKYMEM